MVPFIIAMGVGIDMSRVTLARTALQSAVDGAAVAGAGVYHSSLNSSDAQVVASRYFNRFAQGEGRITATHTATAAPGQFPGGTASFNVTVSATASVPTTFMAVANMGAISITARAVAANPDVLPKKPALPVVSGVAIGSKAMDWNSAYIYPVPFGVDGKPNFAVLPSISQFYQITSNCNQTNEYWTAQSRCNNNFGAIVPANQTFPAITVDQPLAFMFVNMSNGLIPPSSNGYGANSYGATPGSMVLHKSAHMSLNRPPTYDSDRSAATIFELTGITVSQAATRYATLNSNAVLKPNCAIQIQQVDPANLPTTPPRQGTCFSATEFDSGSRFANLSCAQMAGRTFMYWWNEMGGSTDDKDYNDLYFLVSCAPGAAVIGNTPSTITTVTLIR